MKLCCIGTVIAHKSEVNLLLLAHGHRRMLPTLTVGCACDRTWRELEVGMFFERVIRFAAKPRSCIVLVKQSGVDSAL